MVRISSVAALFMVLAPAVLGCAASSQASSPPENDAWLADAETGCKFSVKWLKPCGGEGGVWRLESAQTAKWAGACADGLASGVGTAIVSVRPVLPGGDPKTGKPLLDQLFSHWPPYDNLFYGNFDQGKPNGSIVVRYSNGFSAIETYDHGVVRGDPVAHFSGERIEWVTLPLDQLERAVRQDFTSGRIRPRPIDPRQGSDAGWGMVNGRIKVARLLDVSGYADIASFKNALDNEFPKFTPAPELLNHLVWLSDENLRSIYFDDVKSAGCRHTSNLLLISGQRAWNCVYAMQKDANTKNREKWVYAAEFSDDATLMYYELHRYFSPDDFASRGIPLRVENFLTSKDFMSAAMQLLGPTPTMEQVAQLMESAGMKPSNAIHGAVQQTKVVSPHPPPLPGSPSATEEPSSPPQPQPIRAGYYDERASKGQGADKGEGGIFQVLLTGCGTVTTLDFEFDPVTKAFLKVRPYDDAGCL